MKNAKQEKFKLLIQAIVTMHNQVKDYRELEENLAWDTIKKIYSKIESEVNDDREMFLKACMEILTGEDSASEDVLTFTELVLHNTSWQTDDFAETLRGYLEVAEDAPKKNFFAKCVALCQRPHRWDWWLQDTVNLSLTKPDGLQREITLQVLLAEQDTDFRILILEQLLHDSRSYAAFFEISEMFRKEQPEKWLDCIGDAVAAKARNVVKPLDGITIDTCHEIMQVLTQRAYDDQQGTFTKRALLFFSELMTREPRAEILAAWENMETVKGDVGRFNYLKYSLAPWVDDEFPGDKKIKPVKITD